MALVRFTENIQRHVACQAREVAGDSVREVLAAVFADNDRARTYVLDDAGGLRRHMMVFVDGELIHDRAELSDLVGPEAKVDVMQALSGG